MSPRPASTSTAPTPAAPAPIATAPAASHTVLDRLGRLTSRLQYPSLDVAHFDEWNADLEDALRALPELRGVSHDAYIQLALPTEVPKRHALVSDHDGPLAVISVRQRDRAWEPVTLGCIPDAISPCRSNQALGQALKASALNIRVDFGLEEAESYSPTFLFPYEVHQIDLEGDYEAHWRKKGNHKNTKRAAKRCAEMTLRIDDPGASHRLVEFWRAAWADDPRNEACSATDRDRFWSALSTEPYEDGLQLVTVELMAGDDVAAGTIGIRDGKHFILQCLSRNPEYDWHMAGTRAIEATVELAVEQNCTIVDFGGGGGYKRWWAPINAMRYGLVSQPPATRMVYAAGRVSRVAKQRVSERLASFRGDADG